MKRCPKSSGISLFNACKLHILIHRALIWSILYHIYWFPQKVKKNIFMKNCPDYTEYCSLEKCETFNCTFFSYNKRFDWRVYFAAKPQVIVLKNYNKKVAQSALVSFIIYLMLICLQMCAKSFISLLVSRIVSNPFICAWLLFIVWRLVVIGFNKISRF